MVAVVPARDEADVIARSVGSLLQQDYPGPFRVVLVDDGSTDGTAAAAGTDPRLEVLPGAPLPAGWTGKLWAQQQGVARASDRPRLHPADRCRYRPCAGEPARPGQPRRAGPACHGDADGRTLLRHAGGALPDPGLRVLFPDALPFAWVARRDRRTAAAAGGCMLVRRAALEAAGGMASIRAEIIDDCALGRRMKAQGPVWLGLTRRARSLRPYGSVAEIGRMVSRSAYAQLGYSPLLLAGTVLGMVLTYLLPRPGALRPRRRPGGGRCGLAADGARLPADAALLPRLAALGLALPAIGAAYTFFTLQSAVQVWRGQGGMWKGRAQAMAGEA
ncbi:glycosyltransferase [Pseudoroseomonas wenyumeiae]